MFRSDSGQVASSYRTGSGYVSDRQRAGLGQAIRRADVCLPSVPFRSEMSCFPLPRCALLQAMSLAGSRSIARDQHPDWRCCGRRRRRSTTRRTRLEFFVRLRFNTLHLVVLRFFKFSFDYKDPTALERTLFRVLNKSFKVLVMRKLSQRWFTTVRYCQRYTRKWFRGIINILFHCCSFYRAIQLIEKDVLKIKEVTGSDKVSFLLFSVFWTVLKALEIHRSANDSSCHD